MCQVRNFLSLILSAAALAACGADDHQVSQSAVGRNFDELASAVAGCADALSSCDREASDETETDACHEEFSDCRTRAGKEAENALAEAISTCQERASACRADASTDASKDGCATTLRTCVGEATAQARNDSEEDGGPSGRAHAPTYQCFGQLRECIDDDKAPKECAAQTRACVIAAVQPADAGRPSTKPPAAGHASDAGRGGSSGAGTGGAGGKAGAAGEHAKAGQGGAAGSRATAGSGGAGGAKASGAGGTGDVARECTAAHEACLMHGEKPMNCAKEQRKCLKTDSGEDEP